MSRSKGTWRSHQVPVADGARERRPPRDPRAVAAQLPARASCSTSPGGCGRNSRELAPAGERRMSANPHANGGALLRDLVLPDFHDYAVDVPTPGDDAQRGDPRARRLPAGRDRPQPVDLPALRARRDCLEPPRRSCSRSPIAPGMPQSSRPTRISPRSGRVMEVLSEHQCQGWLEGYLLTGRHGLFNCYEAFIHIVDSMFNQHAKWLKVTAVDPLAAADCVAQLPAQLARVAAGPQRLLAPGPRLHRPRREQEGGDHPRLPAAGRELPALGRRPLPAQPRTT